MYFRTKPTVMKKILSGILMCFSLAAMAQHAQADNISTSKGALEIQPVTHASLIFTFNKMKIFMDPYSGAEAYKDLGQPDMIIITDIHPDHLDHATLNGLDISKLKTVIAPQAVADKLPENLKKMTKVLENGKTITESGIKIEAIPMYNLPEDPSAMHTKGRGNGYVLTFGDKRVYVSGDTEDIPEMRKLKNIDVAFVCMNLPYTMDVKQAASAVIEFKPKIVYPFHYRGQDGLSNTEEFKNLVNKGDPKIDVRLRDWYAR